MIDNVTYSSLQYHEMPGVMMTIGHTILTMVGNERARYRSSIQPMMTRQQAMGCWREKWIEPFVATFVDDIQRQEGGTDLASPDGLLLVSVALANKIARMVWALLTKKEDNTAPAVIAA